MVTQAQQISRIQSRIAELNKVKTEIGVARSEWSKLARSTRHRIQSLEQSNPQQLAELKGTLAGLRQQGFVLKNLGEYLSSVKTYGGRLKQAELSRIVRKRTASRLKREIFKKALLKPTSTEQKLQMSLPADLRNLSVQEVLTRQSIPPQFRSGIEKFRATGKFVPKPTKKIQRPVVVKDFGDITKMSVPRTKTQKAITKFGSKLESNIERLRLFTLKKISPSFKREVNKQIKENTRIENKFDSLSKQINSFNKKFIGRELNQEEFDIASKKSKRLEEELRNFDKLVETIKEDQSERLTEEQKLGPFKPVTLGVVSAPFSLASFSVSLLTRPGVGKEFIKGVKEVPAQFREAPVTTAGEITGQLIGTGLIFKGGASLKKIASNKSLLQSGKSFIIEKPGKIKKTPLSRTFPEEFKLRINEKNVESFVKQQLKNRGVDFNKLSKIEKEFLTGQVKAKIRNNPELFIPKARRQALKNVKKTELKKVLRERLEGKFDEPIILKTKKSIKELTPIQKKALKRFARVEEQARIKRAVKKRLKIKEEKLLGLSKVQKDLIVSRIRARVKADPSLTLTKTQRKALNKAKTKSEFKRIDKAISKRLKIKKEKPTLTKSQISSIKSKIKSVIKSQPERFIPKQRRLALKRLQQIQEKKAIKRAVRKGPKKLTTSDLLSKSDKSFIVSRIKAQARTQPERFIPKARRQALIQIQKPKVKTQILKIKIVEGKITPQQKLALKRFKNLHKKKVQTSKQINKIKIKQSRLNKNIKQTQKQLQKQKQKIQLKQKQKQKVTNKQKQAQRQAFKKVQRQKFKLKQVLKQKFIFGLREKQLLKQSESLKLKILQKPALKQPSRLKERLRLKERERLRVREPIKPKLKPTLKEKKFLLIKGRRKRRRKIIKKRKPQAYQVWARPLKRKGQKKLPKLIKVSKVPLTKKRARDLRNYIADTSLSRTARIKPIKGKPTTSKLKVPKGYSRKTFGKFRRYRIKKGKRIPLKKGRVIELGRHLLDTRQEKKRIGLKRRIAQIRKPSKRKSTKRKSIKRKTSPKRSGGIFG